MTRLRWSPRAVQDLEAIRDYVAGDSAQYARLVVQRLVSASERLEQFPVLGRVVPEVGDPELRELIVTPYRLVYRTRADRVEIVTVFRSARSFPRQLA